MGRIPFVDLLAELGAKKHTGAVVLHLAGGVPRSVEILAPSERIALDTGRGSAADLTAKCTLASARSADASA